MGASNHTEPDGHNCAVLICADAVAAKRMTERLGQSIRDRTLEWRPSISATLSEPKTAAADYWLAWLERPEMLVGYPEHSEIEEAAGLPPLIVLHPADWTSEMRNEASARGAFFCLREDYDETDLHAACQAALGISLTRAHLREASEDLVRLADRRSRELYEARELSHALFMLATDLAFLIRPQAPDFPILEANASASNILREFEPIVQGAPFSRYITDESIRVLSSLPERLEGRVQDLLELSFRARDSERMQASVVARKVRQYGEDAILLLCTLDRRSPARQRDSQRLRVVAARTGMVMYDVNVRENHITFSGALQELTGINPREFDAYQEGRWLVLVHPDDRKAVLAQYNNAIAECGKYEMRYRVKQRNGNYRHVEDVGVCIPGKDGRTARVLGTVKDITGRVEQEQAFRKAEAARIHSQKLESLGVLAGGIAHDFNNILAAIIGLTSLALQDLDEKSDLHSDLSEVLRAGNRARDLVRQILTFSRQGEVERTPIELHKIVNEVVRLVHAGLPRDVRVEVMTSPTAGRVLANPAQMHQVVLNYCTNAVQAMRESGGVLRLSVQNRAPDDDTIVAHPRLSKRDYLVLSVSDEGHGMTPNVIERIFDPFFTTKGPGEGTGMGLAVVHGIVSGHGGAIAVKSKVGEGTVFHTYFPLVEELPELEEADAPPPPGAGEVVLVLRTDEVIGAFVSATLRHQGYNVQEVFNTADALNMISGAAPNFDVFVADTGMASAGMSEVLNAAAHANPVRPVILIEDMDANEQPRKLEGKVVVLEKPLTFEQLSRATRTVLDEAASRA